MKKVLFSLVVFVSSLLFVVNVNASSFDVNIIGNDTFENEISLYIEINNLVDFTGNCKGLCGLVGNLDYDEDKIELVSINALDGFDLVQGKKLVLYKSNGVPSGTKILEVKFKNKTLVKDEKTLVKFLNVVASDGDKDINTNDVSKTIKFIVKETQNSSNQINNNTNKKPSSNISNKNEDTKKSNNNYLSSINLSQGNIAFDKDVLTYDVIVDYEIAFIKIDAILEDNKAMIFGDGRHNLKVGNNVINLNVKAEDGSERIYTLNVKRDEDKKVIDNNIVQDDIKEDNNNSIIFIVVGLLLFIVGVITFIVISKKGEKTYK